MEKKENPKKKLKNSKEKIDLRYWKIDYRNTSDIGYPNEEDYLSKK